MNIHCYDTGFIYIVIISFCTYPKQAVFAHTNVYKQIKL